VTVRTRAEELREAFDHSFAVARMAAATDPIDLLAIDLGGDRHAVRLADITGAFVDRAITRVPSDAVTLVGIAGFRGAIVPVFDLALVLGYAAIAAPRWLLVADQLALAVGGFAGRSRVAPSAFAVSDDSTPRTHVREVVQLGTTIMPVVDVASVIATIRGWGKV
jgi:purine-binding chemotaxis protein CheW